MTVPTGPPHLTLAELAASAASQPLPAGAAAHLHTCAACQARSHGLVPDGVSYLLTRCQPPPDLMDRVFEAIDSQPAPTPLPAPTPRPAPTRGRYRARRLALGAAVAAVLLGGATAGLVTALSPAGTAPAAEGGGNAIAHAGVSLTECPRVQLQVLGRTLLGVSGTDLELEGPGSTPLTVTTSATTEILREVTGTVADVSDGAHVLVAGKVTGAAIAGLVVDVMPGTGSAVPSPEGGSRAWASSGLAYGTVEDNRGAGFSVLEGDGTGVPVTMSASSLVIRAVHASLGEFQAGQGTSVVVTTGPDGTLTAISAEQASLPAGALQALKGSLPQGRPLAGSQGLPGPQPSSPPQAYSHNGPSEPLPSLLGGAHRPFASLGCDPSAITSVNMLVVALTLGS
jgi:hypothetical protein